MGFPFELITMLGSGLLTAVLSIWAMKAKIEAARQQYTLELLSKQTEAVEHARSYGTKNHTFEITRRTIALMSVFAVIVLPKLAALFSIIPVTVGYTEFNPGFWFFTDGHDIIKWRDAVGFVITPLDTHFCSAVAGMYFGASVVKNA
jgi:DUF438 domain-containing protein